MKNKKLSTICTIIALILLVVILCGIIYGYYKKKTLNINNPVATIEVENFGTIKVELYPNIAPNSVSNFIKLANNGFYNGLKFHRVVEGFMIQGGDKEGTGSGSVKFSDLYNNQDENSKYKYSDGTEAKGSSSYAIPGEFILNKYTNNNLELSAGTIAMARNDYTQYSSTLSKESYNSAGSQFFIMTTDNHKDLSGYYAGFGKVIEGLDVVQNIEKVECTTSKTEGNEEEQNNEAEETKEKSIPVQDVIIKSITVDTYGVDYGLPTTLVPFNYTKWLYSMYGLPYNEEE